MGSCIRKRVVYDMSCKRFHFFVNVEALLALTLKQTMNRPLIPDSYPFLLPNSMLWSEISPHIGN